MLLQRWCRECLEGWTRTTGRQRSDISHQEFLAYCNNQGRTKPPILVGVPYNGQMYAAQWSFTDYNSFVLAPHRVGAVRLDQDTTDLPPDSLLVAYY